MQIVAHQDDDILFMNPDLAAGLAAGTPTTTIFVTAGDAGLGEAYWLGREDGARAAYSQMTGHDEWAHETLTLDINGTAFQIATSSLAADPSVRLYFLRLPDGGGLLDEAEAEQLAQLEGGTRASVLSQDGANSYSRDDLVSVLTELMELHSPEAFRFQLSVGPHAAGEHTDHIHTAEFAEEALAAYSGAPYSVTHYIQYASDDLPANLTEQEAAAALAAMEAYSAHDPAVLDASGNLLQVYQDWTTRQYTAEEYTVTADAEPPAEAVVYSLTGPDAQLFQIDPETGAITPQSWFTPSLGDAWDADEDYSYEVTRIGADDNGTQQTAEDIVFDTTAEGVLTPRGAGADPATDAATFEDEPPADAPPEDDPPEQEPSAGAAFSLSGPDAFLFQVDPLTGDITPQDWFTPSLGDAWDADEDHLYELTLTELSQDGTPLASLDLTLETTAEGVLTPYSAPPAPSEPVPPTQDESAQPEPPAEPPFDAPTAQEAAAYVLTGPDAQLFQIDPLTGDISPQDWFTPSRDDAWDQNEDHIYEVTRLGFDAQSSLISQEALTFETRFDGSFVQLDAGEALLAMLRLPDPPDETAQDAQSEAGEELDVAL